MLSISVWVVAALMALIAALTESTRCLLQSSGKCPLVNSALNCTINSLSCGSTTRAALP